MKLFTRNPVLDFTASFPLATSVSRIRSKFKDAHQKSGTVYEIFSVGEGVFKFELREKVSPVTQVIFDGYLKQKGDNQTQVLAFAKLNLLSYIILALLLAATTLPLFSSGIRLPYIVGLLIILANFGAAYLFYRDMARQVHDALSTRIWLPDWTVEEDLLKQKQPPAQRDEDHPGDQEIGGDAHQPSDDA